MLKKKNKTKNVSKAYKKFERQNPKEIEKYLEVIGIELKHQIKGGATGSSLAISCKFSQRPNALGTHTHMHAIQEEKMLSEVQIVVNHPGILFPLLLET